MVALEQIRSSNSKIATALRPGLVAVFAGATSGIGETSLKQFAKNAVKPRIYFIGRSKESGNRIRAELQKLNPGGEYIYISVDVSLLRSVDDVCREINGKEAAINLLFLSTGTMVTGKDTEEGLYYPAAVTYYARLRFIVNLLPLLRNATGLRRVVTVLAGTKEGTVHMNDFQGRHMSMLSPRGRGHFSSLMTLALEAVAQNAPNLSFIHNYPGFVKTNFGNDVKGLTFTVLRGIWNAVFPVIGPFVATPINEAGEREVFFATSARFPERGESGAAGATAGVPLPRGIAVARGTDGKSGSGVYSISNDAESAPPKVEQVLSNLRKDGIAQMCLLAAVGGNSSLVAFPSQENYSAIVAPYNLDYPVIPAAVAFPHTSVQVAALVNCAVVSGYKVQAKSGGHSAANYGSSTGELSINLENLQHFSMDESTFVATVGAGLRMGDIDELMYNAGQRFIPHGTSANVGIGGHGTVGGAGFAWRQYGLTIDYIREVELVLADSTIVRASASQNADLFFAIRGAGAGFGIVTEYIFNTLPAPLQTVSFAYMWTAADTPTRAEIFKAWQDWTTNSSLPSEVQTVIGVTATTIFMSGAYFGTLDAFNALGIPSLFPPAQQSSTDVFANWLQLSQLWAEQITQSGRETPAFFYIKSIVFRPETRIPDSVVDQVFEYLAMTDNGTESWSIEIQAGGGHDATIPASATAFPHRDASFVWLSYAATNGRVTATTTAFLDGLDALAKSGHPHEYYGEYAGFIDAREQPGEARYAYWGPNLPRLGQIKAAYDPLDVFHNRQSVLPGGGYS
ncbi:hypothetical protein DL771_003895 [Monosporascus sp. 5C6A]|nr:hypothetical protein DL771_003895 [Monosporascus sp. 5C6A]